MLTRRTPTVSTFSQAVAAASSSARDKGSLHVPYIDTPLPSPSLPSILPRHGKKTAPRWRRRRLRMLFWMVGGLCLFLLSRSISKNAEPHSDSDYLLSPLEEDGDFEIVGTNVLPEQPVALMVTDAYGKKRWTVSIPPVKEFPLAPSEYETICRQCDEISSLIANDGNNKYYSQPGQMDFYRKDLYYMDITDAQDEGLLPGSTAESNEQPHYQKTADTKLPGTRSTETDAKADTEKQICENSLTYVLQSSDAGFGKTLMGLWMSYGLAKEEGRSFFIDDSDWEYGQYSTYFQPPPKPNCLPPPATLRVPCPHDAKHLVVSAVTTPWIFGDSFTAHFTDARATAGINRQRRIFSFLRAGFEALFRLSDEDNDYLGIRLEDLKNSIDRGGLLIGIHVRHGDLHPIEPRYQDAYIPLQKYASAAANILESTFSPTPSDGGSSFNKRSASRIILASDDPDVYGAMEFQNAQKAQSRISLASKSTIDAAMVAQQSLSKSVQKNLGWEGGFFKNLFLSLGAPAARPIIDSPRPSKSQTRDVDSGIDSYHPSADSLVSPAEGLRLRELVGRAYLLDLAVLGHSDRLICGISSVTCRLLAVMMGWSNSLEQGAWHNIDGPFEWFSLSL
ncbi:hypothetical protein ASPZODRAFT_154979 [Penicilliopsis zonata CBS 506.65]|uniref:Uncharacterized protein n=1 Tax=Penicilliopsis zonata CBS 506.65 TaxID=1073090 RepID=A0A1L9S773_9EURO|nr:hypothetical protein ASPZODRAFT_154979 [Penicilliopsis zonata CBS 506.65]OJJ43010.1 hypothetical protein ASPZODRAFT_154979 [Penicilliopsis zonata CBS 506.65]